MADIQPKNTDTIRVNVIKEKTAAAGIILDHITKVDDIREDTAAAGVSINQCVKITTAAMLPQTSAEDLGGSTSAEHWANTYTKVVGTQVAEDIAFKSNNVTRLSLTGVIRSSGPPAGCLKKRLGHTGYTSGGEIEEFTAAAQSTTTSPITLFTYTVPAVDTSVTFHIHFTTRDQTAVAEHGGYLAISGRRTGGGAVAGSVGAIAGGAGAALQTFTVTASGNDLLVRVQNAAGTNTNNCVAHIVAIPVSTST